MGLFFKSMVGLLGGIAQAVGGWMMNYASKENTKARIVEDENSKIDTFHNSLKKKDIDSVRRDLS